MKEINEKILQYQTISDWIERQAKRLKILTCQNEDDNIIDNTVKKFSQICIKTKT